MDQKVFQPNGAAHIAQLIAAAVADGTQTATVTGDWEMDTAVRIPSDFTLILDGCHLRQADGCFSNIFVNEHHAPTATSPSWARTAQSWMAANSTVFRRPPNSRTADPAFG